MRAGSDNRSTALRVAAAGLAAALLAWGTGRALEGSRFGATDQESIARIEAELRGRFDEAVRSLEAIGERAAQSPELVPAASRDRRAVSRLFDALAAALPDETVRTAGITVYSHPGAVPLAWAGRVSELPPERIEGPAAHFVAPRGRLIRVEPVVDRLRSTPARLVTVVVERTFGDARTAAPGSDGTRMETSIAPVSVRPGLAHVPDGSPGTFLVPAADGQILLEVDVDRDDLIAARATWRARTWAAVWAVIGVTLLLSAASLLDVGRRAGSSVRVVTAALAVVGLLAAARLAFRRSTALAPMGESIELLLSALLVTAGLGLLLNLVERRRVATPRRALVHEGPRELLWTAFLYLAVGAAGASFLWAYERWIRSYVSQSALDLTHFSLHPLAPDRLALAVGLVLLHVSVIWGVALLFRLAAVEWRRQRSTPLYAMAVLSSVAGAVLAVSGAAWALGPAPLLPWLVAMGASVGLAIVLSRPRGRVRRASQTARLFTLYLALLIPAVAMYPSLHAFTVEATERVIADRLGPQAASQREDLWRRRVPEALGAIDEMPTLVEFVTSSGDEAAPTSDRAFLIWSQTTLAQYRLTSALELYGPNGRVVSSFALNLPEYTATPYLGGSCEDWDLIEEVPPFGSTKRHVLRASRGICDGRRPVGGIVVRVMFDYRDLPFVSAERRYLDAFGLEPPPPVEAHLGRDIEFSVYGWSRAPLYTSGPRVWPLSDRVFDRLARNRTPFWDTVVRDGERFRVYYLSDRGGIYALGYPSATWFMHLVNLAELVTLTFAVYVVLLAASTLFSVLHSTAPASGRELLREIRSSFYRKLFLFFVAAAVVPVGILALATSTYVAGQLRAGVAEAAVNTATVAQRLVEDYAALQQRGGQALELLDDPIMVLVGRAIDQDVDLFDGPRLQATSERDLFASGVLSERTPSEVFRQIAIERRPTFVGVEEVGGQSYQLAAAPVRAGGREGIVTVPQTLRQQEIERQIDDLDRRVVLGLVLFVVLGAGIGYWMAERIADPVNRLTRATRRIARGDLDARIAATSSDELRRLVEDFNRMAADLKRQRAELERTQRLEAWADMARQVAHDIKNPLTPIQLSAEHARRVNQDRGRPLSPALDECIGSILTQVKLLRQIAAEFSSFASSPTSHPEPTALASLVDEVVEPYRVGLGDRVALAVRSDPALPLVAIDRTLFARALTNVIENALHAMPGGGRLTIGCRLADRGAPPAVVVEVADTGVGMDPEALAKIFEPYFSTRTSGTGLGLTIAKRNIELIGGTIAVASQKGVGTTVTITLPAAPGA